jgi:hypothetical protein
MGIRQGSCHKRFKWFQVLGVFSKHHLRMPLETEEPGAFGSVHRLNDSVWCATDYGKFRRYIPNCLMVKGVGLQLRRLVNVAQTGTGFSADVVGFVRRFESRNMLPVFDLVAELPGDVLNERSPKCNVRDLNTPADAENGYIPLYRCGEEIEFEAVPKLVNAVSVFMVMRIAIASRVNIAAPAEEKAIDSVKNCLDVVCLRRNHEWDSLGSLYALGVRGCHSISADFTGADLVERRARGNSDNWFHDSFLSSQSGKYLIQASGDY